MFVACECCVLLSGRGLCVEPISRPVESYRLWSVSQCDQKKFKPRHWNGKTGVGRRGRLKKETSERYERKYLWFNLWRYSSISGGPAKNHNKDIDLWTVIRIILCRILRFACRYQHCV
jgi:hypothetical protein